VKTQKTTKYSLKWAKEVFLSFHLNYTRATNFLEKYYNIPVEKVVEWIANDQKRWNTYKKAVKKLDSYTNLHQYNVNELALIRKIIRSVDEFGILEHFS